MATVFHPVQNARPFDYGYLLYFGLHFMGFVATTLLMTWGVFALFFLAIGNLSVDGMIHQLSNFAGRYIAADADRIGQFKTILLVAHVIVSSSIMFFRRSSILPRDVAVQERQA